MDDKTLESVFSELDLLARDEYHQSIEDITKDSDPQHSAIRIGRLVGVMLKEPFATSENLDGPSDRTGAYRAWHLESSEQFQSPEKQNTWQYHTLAEIQRELALDLSQYNNMSIYALAQDAQYETGFFGYFARTLRKYICGDPEIRKKVDDAIKNAKGGKNIASITPELLVGSGGLALGAHLVQTIPILGMVGAPVIAAVVVILYTLGVNAFCDWSANLRSDEDEKH